MGGWATREAVEAPPRRVRIVVLDNHNSNGQMKRWCPYDHTVRPLQRWVEAVDSGLARARVWERVWMVRPARPALGVVVQCRPAVRRRVNALR